ncbi:uncharacterized protein LOC133916947 isoform X2 [Phragmites australis]|nr:uncharacterized protein LOC133916947 isoform X2 [Phragmites australis]XP_062216831.1 uncharacterized protein LOC133916947 isoform X2 [Phragmites australis]XP_062216832.1 uncharacterized protein LOC133916947 isoform X2 [Phragmites australis]XP_062216833.1 uncharacterized protein LOC133916947 isoform X2 [Phragmites australis]XP_062216834.1 uncharacterized protein LOC133916947 isoform X2 [Phragmites australis]
MELVYLERRNGLHDESAIPEFSGRAEDQDPSIAASESQSDLGQINFKKPLPSDKKSKSCQSCHKSQCSCSGDAPHSDLYPALPAKMMILEFLIRSLRNPTRTHDVSDLDDLITDGVSQGSVNLGPSEKMVLDSLHALVNAKTRPKSPSLFLPGSKLRTTRSKSQIITQSEILKLISPETWETSSPGASPLKKSTAELSMHEKMSPYCSHTASISSNQPALSHCPSSLSAGLLQCIWKDGLPRFELSLDNPIAVYTAKPIKVQDNDKALDYVYMIHSGEQGRKDWMGHSSNVSRLVGKMKVSSSLVLNSDKSSLMETEFVLYGSLDDYLRQMHSSYNVTKGKGLVKRVTEIMRTGNVSPSPKHSWKFGKSCSHQFDDLTDIPEGEMITARESALTNLDADDLPTNQELAAIVVRDQRHERRKEPVVGGWGLKFLQKAGSSHSEGSEDTDVPNRKGAAKCITAVVPRGYHGGAVSKNSGPSGLVERWRSGGRCDCDGWDLGCPIRVLDNDGCASLPSAESQDSISVELSIKGAKKDETMLRLVNITEDLYILYFDSSLSPLQSFSTGIAIVHSQAPQLCPKL